MKEPIEKSRKRYEAAAHAMQSGVALMLESDEKVGTPKDLRVGVNSAMVEHGALATLLINKGIFTAEEYSTALADAMEREVELYEHMLSEIFGIQITLK